MSHEQPANIYTALAAAQMEMDPAVKRSKNDHFRSRYADLAAVVDAVQPALNKHGIAFFHLPTTAEGTHSMRTVLVHGPSGTTIECDVPLLIGKLDMQSYKSAATYAKRIGLESVTGVAPEDDDGNAAAANPPKPAARATQQAPAQTQTEAAPINSSQAKKEDVWPVILKKFADAKTPDDLDERYHWFIDNGKVPRGWRESYDEEYEKTRDALIETLAATFDHEQVAAQ